MRLLLAVLVCCLGLAAQPALADDPPSGCARLSNRPPPSPKHQPPHWDGRSPREKCYAALPFGFEMASARLARAPSGTIRAQALLFGKNIGWTDVEYEVRDDNGVQLHAERQESPQGCQIQRCMSIIVTMPANVLRGKVKIRLPIVRRESAIDFVTAVPSPPPPGCPVVAYTAGTPVPPPPPAGTPQRCP